MCNKLSMNIIYKLAKSLETQYIFRSLRIKHYLFIFSITRIHDASYMFLSVDYLKYEIYVYCPFVSFSSVWYFSFKSETN